ncbi:hypothetical protein [Bartonella apis]|uniref:hypothetical protein n=1 Tax=Bartonella apis TaxID=1686310 RepID=UPI00242CC4BB|nr:hypothetical protein [Bartonella apis]
MNSVIAVMLLVSCTDGFSACNAADDMVKVYTTHEACEADLLPSVNHIGKTNEMVFGQCIKADPDFINGDLSIYWRVDENGDLIVELTNDDSDNEELTVPLRKIDKPIASNDKVATKPAA